MTWILFSRAFFIKSKLTPFFSPINSIKILQSGILIKSNESTIVGLNKEVVTYHIKYFLNEINKKEEQFTTSNNHVLDRPNNLPSMKVSKNDESLDVISRYNEFVQSRDILSDVKKNTKKDTDWLKKQF